MNPVQILNNLLQVDRQVALPLLGGLAVVAAAAIVATWDIDFDSAVIVGIYIVGLGAGLYVVSYVLTSLNLPVLKAVLGWFVILFVMLVMLTFFVSAALPGYTPIAPTPCLVRFWDRCPYVYDRIAERNFTPVKPPVDQPPAPQVNVNPKNYRVFVQFAGIIRREDVRSMMTNLQNDGWRVQGVDGGGQRTVKAADVNEVRYTTPSDEAAAQTLARSVQAANLTGKIIQPVRVQSPPIADRTLEVWISR